MPLVQIRFVDDGELFRALEALGADPRCHGFFQRKRETLCLQCRSVDTRAANALKQELLARGGDAAVHAHAIDRGRPHLRRAPLRHPLPAAPSGGEACRHALLGAGGPARRTPGSPGGPEDPHLVPPPPRGKTPPPGGPHPDHGNPERHPPTPSTPAAAWRVRRPVWPGERPCWSRGRTCWTWGGNPPAPGPRRSRRRRSSAGSFRRFGPCGPDSPRRCSPWTPPRPPWQGRASPRGRT